MSPRLPEPATPEGAAGLAALLADPARAVVALDYDGTLAPIVDRPDEAHPATGAVPALARLARSVGVVALITGRPARQVVELAGLDSAPGLSSLQVLGQYGLQRWDARSGFSSPEPLPGVADARERIRALLADSDSGSGSGSGSDTNSDTTSGVRLEDKEQALVVHFRQAGDPDAAFAALEGPLTAIGVDAGLEPHPGRRVLELRPPGHDKGRALTDLIAEHDARAVLFAGDDLGDLPAFDAVRHVRARGVPGVLVWSASAEVTAGAEQADLVVDGPAGVVELLSELAGLLGDG